MEDENIFVSESMGSNSKSHSSKPSNFCNKFKVLLYQSTILLYQYWQYFVRVANIIIITSILHVWRLWIKVAKCLSQNLTGNMQQNLNSNQGSLVSFYFQYTVHHTALYGEESVLLMTAKILANHSVPPPTDDTFKFQVCSSSLPLHLFWNWTRFPFYI